MITGGFTWNPAPAPPPAAAQVFGAELDRAVRYAELLAGEGQFRGLLGPREAPRLWDRHLLNCAVVAPAAPAQAVVCDLGAGAGLPGIAWALARTDLSLVLLEPSQRRVQFLREVVAELALGHVSVVRGRADGQAGLVGLETGRLDSGGHSTLAFDVITARAVAPLARLAGWALPLCRPGGELIALKGTAAGTELSAAEPTLRRLTARSWRLEQWGQGVVDPPTTVVRVRAGGPGR